MLMFYIKFVIRAWTVLRAKAARLLIGRLSHRSAVCLHTEMLLYWLACL